MEKYFKGLKSGNTNSFEVISGGLGKTSATFTLVATFGERNVQAGERED